VVTVLRLLFVSCLSCLSGYSVFGTSASVNPTYRRIFAVFCDLAENTQKHREKRAKILFGFFLDCVFQTEFGGFFAGFRLNSAVSNAPETVPATVFCGRFIQFCCVVFVDCDIVRCETVIVVEFQPSQGGNPFIERQRLIHHNVQSHFFWCLHLCALLCYRGALCVVGCVGC
jgi:hypothetical protein